MTASSISNLSHKVYGEGLAEGYGVEGAPFVVTRSLSHADLAVTEINIVRPSGETSVPLARQDAYLIVYHLNDLVGGGYWEDGAAVPPSEVLAGSTTIHDLRREPVAMVDRPMHTVHWYVPRATLNVVADEANAPNIDHLRHEPGVGVPDEAIAHMSLALLPALRAGEPVSQLFADHLAMAFAAHLAEGYGGVQATPRPFRGGLTPWQERQAKDMLLADLAGQTPLATIAAACGLSGAHLARAFRQSTGLPPHAWLNKARVERAMVLLRERRKSLSDIALECGFSDQSHFTRVFARRVGLAPGAWRRTLSS